MASAEPYADTFLRTDRAGARRLTLFDLVIGNTDRHAGNMMRRSDGSVVAIDHGLTMPVSEVSDLVGQLSDRYGNTQLRHALRGNRLTADERALLANVRAGLRERGRLRASLVEAGLDQEALRLMLARVEQLLDSGTYP